MDFIRTDFLLFLVIGVLSFIVGVRLRIWWTKKKKAKLITQLESFLNQPLPYQKRSKSEVNWDKVYKILKTKPTTQEVAHFKELVKREMSRR